MSDSKDKNKHHTQPLKQDTGSVANSVNRHLLKMEDDKKETLEPASERDDYEFSPEELVCLVNSARLEALLEQSDAFINGLTGALNDFDD
ncbi:hypothetical protein [Psychrobacter pygoscelis]|uniref:hypothetical protein n=1 Tax=Psychrobacter pygoscelis TaxID=2488563 RepID=UPI00103B9F79|nr:hypothetical protein [Psychrobacter pygoscelis]